MFIVCVVYFIVRGSKQHAPRVAVCESWRLQTHLEQRKNEENKQTNKQTDKAIKKKEATTKKEAMIERNVRQ